MARGAVTWVQRPTFTCPLAYRSRVVRYSPRMDRNPRMLVVTVALAACAFFAAAMAFPAVGTCPDARGGPSPEWFDNRYILLFGWLAVFIGQAGWFANIPFALTITALLRGRVPGRWLVAAHAGLLALGVVSLQPRFGMRLPHNEAFSDPVCRIGGGFWLWVAAHVVTIAAAWAVRRGLQKRTDE